jgi:hypothetical protein
MKSDAAFQGQYPVIINNRYYQVPKRNTAIGNHNGI